MAALMRQEAAGIAEQLGSEQYAVGRDAGLEALLRHADRALAMGERRFALLFDAVCAFSLSLIHI
eukprot:9182899-Alexandrium_andersonii.AAC.1